MTPTPQETIPQAELPSQRDGDRIVISGMSGLFPNCHNVKDFSDLLYDKVNPVISGKPRWKYNHPEVLTHLGTVPELDRFDAQFFGIHFRLATTMDTMARKVLEQTYNAIYDAGLAPEHVFGRKVGVYIGTSFMESEKACFYDAESRSGFSIVGCCKTMFANRISYWLNAKGPSMAVDAACCSSAVALEQAYRAMKRGECDAAIVGGTNVCLHPQSSVHFTRIMKACSDGKTKSFDENADGSAKSEAISILVLQKMKDARRIYAEVLHVKSQFMASQTDEQGLKFELNRDSKDVTKFLQQFYEETKVQPQAVEYVEAMGCAVPEVDKMELDVFERIFCNKRTEPLLVGSVMSNIGYVEAASGLSAITKVLIGYEKGRLPANLHCTNPRRDVDALREGRMRIVTEHQPIRRSYIAVNGMSISGVNTHVLLHGYYKPKDPTHYQTNIPRLVTISGRQESSVKKIFDDLKRRRMDPEEIALLHNIHEMKIFGHMSWGFTILDKDENGETVSLSEKIDHFDDVKRPLWFVYSGMGSQWPGMAAQLMRIPTFAAAIQRCHNVLAPKGLDIVHIITNTEKTMFDYILHAFVGITAVQIALTDVLYEIGLVPDNIIGHSQGEIGCAYADGCFTAEETILAAYSRGLVSVQTPFIKGSMAAVGIGYQEVKNLCPPEIEVACHNGPDSSTISGPVDVMNEFVGKLTSQGIFAKEVPCSNIAFHSRYIAQAGPKLMEYLQEVIKNPKARTERWLSTSVPQEKWSEENAKYSSAWYHTNNLLNPVLFEETSRLVPSNAVLVEVAPHGLLQAILKRSLPADCRNIPITKRGHPDNVVLLLEGIGKLYMEGHISKVANLYPKVEFPVSTGTPMLSHLVEWNHTEKWKLPLYLSAARKTSASRNMIISVHDDEHAFLQGHVLREKMVYPFAAALAAVWDTLAMSFGVAKKQLSVEFRDVHLFAQPALPAERQLRISVALHKGTGRFEVLNEQSRVASGFINELPKDLPKPNTPELAENLDLDSESVYALLKERDYYYSGQFRSIHKVNTSFTKAQLLWNNNWVTFIDGMLQLSVLKHSHSTISQPSHINKISVDVKSHSGHQEKLVEKTVITVLVSENKTRCGGILVENIQFYDLPQQPPVTLSLNTQKFGPHAQSQIKMDTDESLIASRENGRKDRGMMLQCGRIGDLDSLRWVESPALPGEGIEVTVHYATLNDLDVKRATGVVSFKQDNGFDDNTYGMDFSGLTDSGVRVMGMASGGAANSRVQARRELLWPVPAHWTLEDAATVPSAYAQAFYCLGIKSKLSPGMTVLVHGGAGALGQAAISIALAHQCRVFTTVSTLHKKRFLTKLFPDLNEDDIGNSRDHTFADMVLRATNTRGCDIIISCVRGNIKNATLKCGAYCGITFDTVQAYTEDNYAYGMYYMTKQRTYSLVDFTSIFKYKERMVALRAMVTEGIARGFVRPLSRVVYAAQDAPRAFRLLAASRHRGRVLLQLTDSTPAAKPRISYSEESSHVIVCDNDGLGVQLANRLVSRGVKKLRLHCAKVPNHLLLKVKTWKNLGVETNVSSEDLSTSQGVQILLNNSLGPIEGIHLVVIGDAENKIHVSNLDLGSRKLCPSLKYFAVVTADSSFGHQTYLDRIQNKLPMTLLHLPALTKGAIVWRSALDAIESALRSQQQLLIAEEPKNLHQSLFQQIAKIAGIGLQDNVEKTTTLKELGLDSSKLQAVSAFLLNTYNVCYSEEQIMELSVQDILDLDESQKDLVFKEAKGLEMFFSNVEPDELLATAELVFLSTLARNVSTRDDEIDANMTYLCIVPGLEGLHNRFTTMCSRLKVPAMVLQPGLDNLHEPLLDTARRYTEILLKKSTIGNNFYLVGYEIGILMALQIAANLEEKGYIGTVFCVGGAPEEVLREFNEQLRELDTKEALRDAVVKHMATVILDGFDLELANSLTWQEKLDACVTSLLSREPHSLQYAQSIVEAAYARIEHVRSFKLQPRRLRSQIVILRPASIYRSDPEVLQQYSHQPIVEYDLQAPLAHAAMDPRCAAFINRHLSPEILESYESRNLCETYLLNADTFITKADVEDD